MHHLEKTLNHERPDIWFSIFPYLGKDNDGSYFFSLPSNNQGMAVDVVNKHGELELPTSEADESSKLLQSQTSILELEHQKVTGTSLISNQKCAEEISRCKDTAMDMGNHVNRLLHDSVVGDDNLSNTILPSEKVQVDSTNFSSDQINAAVYNRIRSDGVDYYHNGVLHVNGSSDIKFQKDRENMEFQTVSSHMDASSTSLKFPAGYELHEALGPAFLKKSKYFDWEAMKGEEITPEMPEKMNSSRLISNSRPEHLLDAVVANACQSQNVSRSEKSFCKSMQSLLTTENYPEPSCHTTVITDSSNHSIGQRSLLGEETQHCLSSSGISDVMTPKGFSSTCPSAGSEQLERSSVPTKNNKKRARPGENCRPRPRDRQLIQDRIKELRDLIPSGAKVSSLLYFLR